MSEPIGQGLHYYLLPKDEDPVAALNILRAARGRVFIEPGLCGRWATWKLPLTSCM
jgi:hypothetical protein